MAKARARKRKTMSKGRAASKLPANHKTKGRHGKATVRWGTPEDVLERERTVFRQLARNEYEREHPIDLDPFTEDRFNEIVRASVAFSLRERKEDGLALPWSIPNAIGVRLPWTLRDDKAPALAAVSTRAHVNHPGGLTEESWRKLVAEHRAGRVRAAFWIGFSVEQLAILADERPGPLDFSCLILRKRIPFVHHNRKIKKRQPSHANYIVAIGVPIVLFEQAFGDLGKIVHGVEATLETIDGLRNRAPEVAAQLESEHDCDDEDCQRCHHVEALRDMQRTPEQRAMATLAAATGYPVMYSDEVPLEQGTPIGDGLIELPPSRVPTALHAPDDPPCDGCPSPSCSDYELCSRKVGAEPDVATIRVHASTEPVA